MAYAGRAASRHGRYDALRMEFTQENASGELPSQSVFSYEGVEDVKRARENPSVHRQRSATRQAMSQGVIPSGPVVAVHMFDVSSDKSNSRESSPRETSGLRRWSREALDGSDGFPPASPRPPSTPKTSRSRPGSMRRRSQSGQRPLSSKNQRPPSSRQYTSEFIDDQEDLLPPMTTLRPQSSLGKYQVLPSISPTTDALHVDPVSTSRSDGSEDQRGSEEMEYLTSRMAHQALVESARRGSKESMKERPLSRDDRDPSHLSENSTINNLAQRNSGPLPPFSTFSEDVQHLKRQSSSGSTTSTEPVLDRSHTSISHYKMDDAPKPAAEGQVLLGIKIPVDGTRHKHYFNRRDQLRCIVLYAEEVSGEDFSNHILVLTTPRRRFCNLSETIEAAGLENKSVLHLEELD